MDDEIVDVLLDSILLGVVGALLLGEVVGVTDVKDGVEEVDDALLVQGHW